MFGRTPEEQLRAYTAHIEARKEGELLRQFQANLFQCFSHSPTLPLQQLPLQQQPPPSGLPPPRYAVEVAPPQLPPAPQLPPPRVLPLPPQLPPGLPAPPQLPPAPQPPAPPQELAAAIANAVTAALQRAGHI